MIKLGVLISGNGTNLQAIIDAIRAGELDASVEIVISSKPEAPGLQRAAAAGIQTMSFGKEMYAHDRDMVDALIAHELKVTECDYVVMAGYMRMVGRPILEAFPDRVINIHPALLPLFKGLDTHKRALEAGVRVHGCTVHFASCELDGGPIVGQAVVPVVPTDTPEKLAARGLKLEHVLFPRCVHAVATGAVKLQDGRVMMSARTAQNLAVFDNLIE